MSERQARRERMLAYLGQPYVRKLNAAIAAGAIPMVGGTVGHIDVRHDDDCGVWRGRFCNCNPDLSLRWEPSTGVVA